MSYMRLLMQCMHHVKETSQHEVYLVHSTAYYAGHLFLGIKWRAGNPITSSFNYSTIYAALPEMDSGSLCMHLNIHTSAMIVKIVHEVAIVLPGSGNEFYWIVTPYNLLYHLTFTN